MGLAQSGEDGAAAALGDGTLREDAVGGRWEAAKGEALICPKAGVTRRGIAI